MEAAYVFGNLGNLSEALGTGWSVEDAFAWTVGDGRSEVTLALPGDDLAYVLRIDLHPALFPPTVRSQRLTIRAGAKQLAFFEMKGRETVEFPLPPNLTRRKKRLRLSLVHPDAARPSDHGPSEDNRPLAFCFHSASLAQQGTQTEAGRFGPTAHAPQQVHGLITGGASASQIADIVGKLLCLKGRFSLHYVDTTQPLTQATAHLPAGVLETVRLCLTEMNAGIAASRDAIRAGLPSGCPDHTLYTPTCQALWPFRCRDTRAVPEPGRYPASRYPYGDRVAQSLASLSMNSDMLYLMYESATNQEKLDLDAMFADDVARWQQADERSNLRLTDFIVSHFRSERLFISPDRVGPALLHQMVVQLLDDPLIHSVVPPEIVSAELDFLLDGFTGRREELPVHPRVAQHFGLSWWSPSMPYRWMNNRLSHRDYVLNYMKWAPWRP